MNEETNNTNPLVIAPIRSARQLATATAVASLLGVSDAFRKKQLKLPLDPFYPPKGWNKPCPCGSGKKLKMCCGAEQRIERKEPHGNSDENT